MLLTFLLLNSILTISEENAQARVARRAFSSYYLILTTKLSQKHLYKSKGCV